MSIRARLIMTFVVLLACPAGFAGEESDKWPQWRGPNRDGTIAASDWPASLDENALSQQWRVELGPSYSGPIVDEQRVYTTETRDAEREVISAYDRQSGGLAWTTEWEGAMTVPFFAAVNGSWIRATPAVDEEALYVAGMRDVLVCLDKATGKQRWRVDFVKEFGTPLPSFGFVSSPLVDGEYLYVQAGGGVVRLRKRSGEVVWRTAEDGGGMNGSAFSSPVIAELAGQRQLLVQGREKLMGIDLDGGEVIWSQPIQSFRGMNILTPTIYNGGIFTSAHSGTTQLWNVTSDGAISEVWRLAAQAYMSSPVVVEGHAYLHLKNQRLACIDLATGQQRWRTRPFGKYWSMVTNGKRILALDEDGTLRLIEAHPDAYTLVDQRKVSKDPTWAHLAIAGDQVFVRELQALAAYRWKQ